MAFGKPTDYGLDTRDISGELPGHIYVEGDPVLPRPDGGPPERTYCVVVPENERRLYQTYRGSVPAGWRPP